MPSRGKLAAAVITAVASLAASSPASATDASIKAAWDANDPQFAKLGKQQRSALRTWERSGFKKSGAVLRNLEATRKLLATNTKAMGAQPESSPTGARAKKLALACNASFDRSLVLAGRGVRLRTAGKRAAGIKLLKQADRYSARSARQAKAAKRLFRQAL